MVGGFFRNNSKKGLTNVSFREAILLSADSKMALVVRSVFQHTELQGGVFMKPKVIKKALKDTIQAMTDCSWLFSARPGKDNTRNRKFPFQKVVSSILAPTRFGLGAPMTRGAFVVALCRLFGWEMVTPEAGSYTDNQDKSAWYYSAVETAYANGAITRLTVNDFASAAEFQRWKDWMDMEHHIEEKQDHIYRNHTVCFQGYEDPTHSVADEAAAWEQQEAGQRQEQAHRDLLLQVRSVLTETQYRRAWMYYAEGKDTYEIAQIEGTCHQAISQSLNAAQKKIFRKLKKA